MPVGYQTRPGAHRCSAGDGRPHLFDHANNTRGEGEPPELRVDLPTLVELELNLER